MRLVKIKEDTFIQPENIDVVYAVDVDEGDPPWTEVRLASGYIVVIREPLFKVLNKLRSSIPQER